MRVPLTVNAALSLAMVSHNGEIGVVAAVFRVVVSVPEALAVLKLVSPSPPPQPASMKAATEAATSGMHRRMRFAAAIRNLGFIAILKSR
ncbi:hypothetical protein MAFF211271_33060 (plasmid) [Ralstonia syzygii subsp. indonesiensis]|nr:hypothetical protein MAFF211271_33060 [Ralstonia pseudosolanacearum]